MGASQLFLAAALLAPAALAAAPWDPSLAAALRGEAPVQVALDALLPLQRGSGAETFARLAELAGASPDTPAPALPPAWLAEAPAQLRPGLALLGEGLAQASIEVERALAGLSEDERARLVAHSGEALRAARDLASGVGTPDAEALLGDRLDLVRRVALGHLAAAELALVRAAEQAAPLLRAPSLPLPRAHCAAGAVVFETAGCQVVVGGPGPNAYTINIALLVDQGGQDTYKNNAGGANAGAALLLDLGSGDDTYESPAAPGEAVQGSGVVGAGLLMDEGGDDTYDVIASSSSSSGRVAAQGSAMVGAGLLWDRGGSDEYTSRNIAQGAALTGLALLLDEGGDDDYEILPTFDSEAGQGAGCFGGFGALVDRGAGADDYLASVDDMQGFGCIGALGLLWDGGGDDDYVLASGLGLVGSSTVVESGFGQGYGELASIAGVLLDLGGDDTYTVTGSSAFEGWQAQGVGNLDGVGLLLDLGGADDYVAHDRVQGWGGFVGLGALFDAAGDDEYSANAECQGFAFIGVGALLDLAGTDTYTCSEPTTSGTRADGQAWSAGAVGMGRDV